MLWTGVIFGLIVGVGALYAVWRLVQAMDGDNQTPK